MHEIDTNAQIVREH